MPLEYNHRRLVGNPNVLEWLVGRGGLSVEAYLDAMLR